MKVKLEVEMPEGCYDCQFCAGTECGAIEGMPTIDLFGEEGLRPKWCPLTPEENADWIPVSERLPEDDGMYIACFDDDFITAVMYITDRQGAQDWELWADSGEVVAWMPLPEPYKAE